MLWLSAFWCSGPRAFSLFVWARDASLCFAQQEVLFLCLFFNYCVTALNTVNQPVKQQTANLAQLSLMSEQKRQHWQTHPPCVCVSVCGLLGYALNANTILDTCHIWCSFWSCHSNPEPLQSLISWNQNILMHKYFHPQVNVDATSKLPQKLIFKRCIMDILCQTLRKL